MLRWDMKVAGEIRMWTGNICSFTEDITKYIRMMIIADISKDIRKVQALKSRGLRQALDSLLGETPVWGMNQGHIESDWPWELLLPLP